MSDQQQPESIQQYLEKNIGGLVLALAMILSVGGIVEIVPLFYLNNVYEDQVNPQYEELQGIRPYSALCDRKHMCVTPLHFLMFYSICVLTFLLPAVVSTPRAI